MPPTTVTPNAIDNTAFAVSCAAGATFTAANKKPVPVDKADALVFNKDEASFFFVHNSTTGAVVLKAIVSQTTAQKAAGVSVTEKEYSIGANCVCLLRTFDAATNNGVVTLYGAATGLSVSAFN